MMFDPSSSPRDQATQLKKALSTGALGQAQEDAMTANAEPIVDGLLKLEQDKGLSTAASIVSVMKDLESIAAANPDLAGALMAALYPHGDSERLHEVCDGIELWLAEMKSSTLGHYLRRLAGGTVDQRRSMRYRRWASTVDP